MSAPDAPGHPGERPDDGLGDRLDDRLDLDEDVQVDVPADVTPPGEHASELPGDAGNDGDAGPVGEQEHNAGTTEDQPSQ